MIISHKQQHIFYYTKSAVQRKHCNAVAAFLVKKNDVIVDIKQNSNSFNAIL